MKFNTSYDWFNYVPEYEGNRDLGSDKQVSLEVKAMSASDSSRMTGGNEMFFAQWYNKQGKKDNKYLDFKEAFMSLPVAGKAIVWQIATHTRNWRNVELSTGVCDSSIELAMVLPDGILVEIIRRIHELSGMNEEEVKNSEEGLDG